MTPRLVGNSKIATAIPCSFGRHRFSTVPARALAAAPVNAINGLRNHDSTVSHNPAFYIICLAEIALSFNVVQYHVALGRGGLLLFPDVSSGVHLQCGRLKRGSGSK